MNFLNGKKTYIVAIGSVLGAVGGVMTGEMSVVEAVNIVVTALLAATVRNGIASSAK